jgi:hypothetical protein
MSEWVTKYRSTDQTIEQKVTGSGDDAVVEEQVTWHRETPEKVLADLRGEVTDLTDQVERLEAEAARLPAGEAKKQLAAAIVEQAASVDVLVRSVAESKAKADAARPAIVAVDDVQPDELQAIGIAMRIAEQALARANEAHDRIDKMELLDGHPRRANDG